MSWSKTQVNEVVKDIQIFAFDRGRALGYLTGEMRSALVDARLFAIFRGYSEQSVEGAVTAADVNTLRDAVREKFNATYGGGFFE